MNQLIYCSQPMNPLISFSLLGGGISNMALILDESTFIPLSLIRKPSNFPAVTPNVHFVRVQPQSILLDPFEKLP